MEGMLAGKRDPKKDLHEALLILAFGAAMLAGWFGGYYTGINEDKPVKMIEIGGVER